MAAQQRKQVKRAGRPAAQKAAVAPVPRSVLPCVVGIGAAAGGFEAIRKLLSVMPANGWLAFIVVQHLDRRRKSMATELLGPRTALTVAEARDGQDIEADHVYMVPAASEVAVAGNRLRLTPRIAAEKPRRPVDRLFRALAESLQEKAIAVVLSGTGTDGTLGALQIVAGGGIVLVQEPATARYDGMPRSVIMAGAASDVLPVEAMPATLLRRITDIGEYTRLTAKVAGFATASSDLQDLFQSSEIGTIRLDAQMNVRWFNPAATVAMNLRPDDIGRPITDLASALGGEPLPDKARQVLEHLAPVQDEVPAQDGRWFMRRVGPYRVDGGRVDGVIVTLTDITETKRAAAAALAEKEALAATLEKRVDERTRELSALAGALSLAEDRERQAVAADLHDDLAQVLALIKLKLVGLAALRESAATAAPLEEIARLIDTADSRIRKLASQLSNPVLHQLGLVAALGALSDEMHRDYHLNVVIHDDGVEKRLEPPTGVIVFRAVRELLINVAKHAGTLTSKVSCEVDCHHEGQTLVVVVSDEGRGFRPQDLEARGKGLNGLGLPLIRERLRFIGGSFDIVSKPGAGVEATIMVPLSQPLPATGERP